MDYLLKLFGSCICYEDFYFKYVSAKITVRGNIYTIENLLYENNNSFSYLVNSTLSLDNKYMIKRVNCFTVNDIKVSLNEINNYKKFQSQNIIKIIDEQIIQEYEEHLGFTVNVTQRENRYDNNGSTNVLKVCYMLFPYYPLGTLQDCINRRMFNADSLWNEKQFIDILISIAEGLLYLHDPSTRVSQHETLTEQETHNVSISFNDNISSLTYDTPLDQIDNESNEQTDSKIYIHMNLSPSNIMLRKTEADSFAPILSDLSTCICEKKINESIEFKEWIDDNCFLLYRSPELNLKEIDKISTKTDIWSFGCTLYQLLYGISPFQREEQINGVSLFYSIKTGKFSFPDQNESYHDVEYKCLQKFNKITQMCLNVNPSERPTTSEIIQILKGLQIK